MADAPEIPEANDAFQKRVALTIAILAIVFSFISALGDNAKTEALLASNKAANQWAYFQSKSIKGHIYSVDKEMLDTMSGVGNAAKQADLSARYAKEITRYDTEKEEIKKIASDLELTVAKNLQIDDRSDLASIFLQIAMVLGSIAILVTSRWFWYSSMGAGLVGSVIGISGYFI